MNIQGFFPLGFTGLLSLQSKGLSSVFSRRSALSYEKCIFLSHKKVKVKSLSRVRLFAAPWTVAYRAPPSVGFSRQECWSGLPFTSPEDLPDPGIELLSPALAGGYFSAGPPD